MRTFALLSVLATSLLATAVCMGSASAAECPGHPNALGTSRTLVVDPSEHGLLGGMQYRESLPLQDHEVVLTFDDGPLPPHTSRVLDALAAECVKATFFMVGQMVRGYPSVVRRVYEEGHTIANHSQTHPFTFHKMTIDAASRQINDGFESLRAVLGEHADAVAPFFRIPGLLRQTSVENYLTQRDVMVWSVDFLADDWTHISSREITKRAIARIEAKGRGILLLHDIQPATAAALPEILRELKARGFRIVQVVPATADRPKTPSTPEQWVLRHTPGMWPSVVPVVGLDDSGPSLSAPSPANFGVADTIEAPLDQTLALAPGRVRSGVGDSGLSPLAVWPHGVKLTGLPKAGELPAPAAVNFHYSRVWRPASAAGVHKTSFRSGKTAAPAARNVPTGASKKRADTPSPPGAVPAAHPAAVRPVGHQLSIGKPTAALDATGSAGR